MNIGRLVVEKALDYWELNVYDPEPSENSPNAVRCKNIISEFTKACNWGTYEGNHTVEWCAMFAMFCWHKAANLDPKWLAHFSQSTYRLWAWANYVDFNGHANPKPTGSDLRTWIDLREHDDYTKVVQEGDIIIVGDGNPKTGDHVTIAITIAPSSIMTISGNGGGLNFWLRQNNGVSQKLYYRESGNYRPMFACRPALGDLTSEVNVPV